MLTLLLEEEDKQNILICMLIKEIHSVKKNIFEETKLFQIDSFLCPHSHVTQFEAVCNCVLFLKHNNFLRQNSCVMHNYHSGQLHRHSSCASEMEEVLKLQNRKANILFLERHL